MLPLLADIWDNTTIHWHITPQCFKLTLSFSKISFTWILMDVLLDLPPDVLERTTPTPTAFCLPITPLVQLAGEVVWISHRRGLGMPRHRKTRLLHWPAYRLLFLIRVLDWKRIVSNREQGVVPFHLQDFFSHVATAAQTADLWVLKVWIEVNGKPHTFFYHRPSYK